MKNDPLYERVIYKLAKNIFRHCKKHSKTMLWMGYTEACAITSGAAEQVILLLKQIPPFRIWSHISCKASLPPHLRPRHGRTSCLPLLTTNNELRWATCVKNVYQGKYKNWSSFWAYPNAVQLFVPAKGGLHQHLFAEPGEPRTHLRGNLFCAPHRVPVFPSTFT